jgi:hypothetical protein
MPVPPSTIRDAKLSLRCRSSLVDRGVDSSICGAITSTPTHALPGARFVRARQGRQDHVPPHSLSAAWLSRSARPPPFTETLNGRVYRTDGGAEDAAAGWVLAFLCFSSSARKARFSGLEPVRSRNTCTPCSVTLPPEERLGSCRTTSRRWRYREAAASGRRWSCGRNRRRGQSCVWFPAGILLEALPHRHHVRTICQFPARGGPRAAV